MNLQPANIEDVHHLLEIEHLFNEELRYNFANVLEILRQQQRTINSLVTSIAKIDDKLIGNIMGNKGRSKFINEETFYLYPQRHKLRK